MNLKERMATNETEIVPFLQRAKRRAKLSAWAPQPYGSILFPGLPVCAPPVRLSGFFPAGASDLEPRSRIERISRQTRSQVDNFAATPRTCPLWRVNHRQRCGR
jgi:hypothetical protein